MIDCRPDMSVAYPFCPAAALVPLHSAYLYPAIQVPTPTYNTVMRCQIIDFREASSSPLNPLSAQLRQYLVQRITTAATDPLVTCLVLYGGPHNFSAGADLTEFSHIESVVTSTDNAIETGVPSLIDVVNMIEQCSKPVVAAIAGSCLGGGLEVALACHYRICTSSAKLGLPEVHVGAIPGAGGTQRLPRAVGLAEATRMIMVGTHVSARHALKINLVDHVEENTAELLTKAQAWASWAEVMPIRRLGQQRPKEHPAVAHNILHVASLSLPKNEGAAGQKAALQALGASQLALREGMAVESECFIRTVTSKAGVARRHVFFAVRQAQKPYSRIPWEQSHVLLDKKKTVQTAVIGAGTMGGGIALVLLRAGFDVTLVDINNQALQAGLTKLRQLVDQQVKRKRMKTHAAKSILQRLHSTVQLSDLSHCQLVVEAVVENLPIKRKIFQTLDQILPSDSLLLSNTSTLSIDAMAIALRPERRARFAGWHFFSPAHVMKLVEIVTGQATSPETVLLMQVLTKRIGKTGVVVRNCDGFCGNRLLRPYSAEMAMVVSEGVATISSVDHALRKFGMALGPFEMSDLAGGDVGYNIRKERGWVRLSDTDPKPHNRPARYTELGDDMIAKYGRLGQKVGKGWYDYDPSIGKGRTPLPSPEVDAIVGQYVKKNGRPILTPEQIVERLLFPLVNEGYKCLEEGIVQRPSDIDVVYAYGYGWPVWRGGPMYWADHEVGLPHLWETLQRLFREFPETEHYRPSKLLETCVRLGTTVEDYCQNQVRSKL